MKKIKNIPIIFVDAEKFLFQKQIENINFIIILDIIFLLLIMETNNKYILYLFYNLYFFIFIKIFNF